MKWKNFFVWLGSALAFFVLISGLWVFHVFHRSLLKHHQSDVIVEIKSGTGLDQFVAQLYAKKLIHHPWFVREWMLWRGHETKLKAGSYLVRRHTTLNDLVDRVLSGEANFARFTIIPGWTYRDVAKSFNIAPDQIKLQLKITQDTPEGLLYPDTYFVASKEDNQQALALAYKKMQDVLQQEWQQRDPNVAYTNPYDALIAASLIEKETAVAFERPLVAAVILNRLKLNMPLQIDPTVVYGLGEPYGHEPTSDELKVYTPYNTYKRRGLPPTPIAMPSRASIHAALHPANTTYLYYFADFSGGHVFSDNYDKHKQAIAAKKLALDWAAQFEDQTRQDYIGVLCYVFQACSTQNGLKQ